MELFDAAHDEAPDCSMIPLAQAWCLMLATEPAANRAAQDIVNQWTTKELDDRSRGHLAGLQAAVAGNWRSAAFLMERHSAEFPRDLIALQAGHLLDFLCADARTLRDRVARALPHWHGVPGASLVEGMLAFGLEETGAYQKAEDTGRAALAADPDDVWAHHAVVHVMEMQGRSAEGLAWCEARAPYWADPDNFLKVHNGWHQALCHIECGDAAAALAVFDAQLAGVASAQDLIDASALLWRLHMMGVDPGERWKAVAAAWLAHADGQLSPFNDLHAAMAWLAAGCESDVDALLERMGGIRDGEVADWTAKTGRPLVLGFRAFAQGRYPEAVDLLWPARRIAGSFGGSHAQRDVIDWTLAEAAIRGRIAGVADALVKERLARRPQSPVNRAFAARVPQPAA
ncbi:MAG: tetratricopeptide repeat protein [Erythrobacter sp.]